MNSAATAMMLIEAMTVATSIRLVRLTFSDYDSRGQTWLNRESSFTNRAWCDSQGTGRAKSIGILPFPGPGNWRSR